MSARALKSAPVRGERVQLAIPRRCWPQVHTLLAAVRADVSAYVGADGRVLLSLTPEDAELLQRELPDVLTVAS